MGIAAVNHFPPGAQDAVYGPAQLTMEEKSSSIGAWKEQGSEWQVKGGEPLAAAALQPFQHCQ